tara:strand:+ start:183 stop:494 length:312 start_codon:yes stop_codon:yes gene_type:complete
MFITSSLLILSFLTFKFLSDYIKQIRTGDPNETNLTYWMFSYDFKSPNEDWVPEDKNFLQKKRTRNTLIFILYLNAFCIFLLLNSFAAHMLNFIVDQRFVYPV